MELTSPIDHHPRVGTKSSRVAGSGPRRAKLLVAALVAALAASATLGACKKRGLVGARAKVEQWAQSWQQIRTCLLGKRDGTWTTDVALLVRDISDPEGSTAVAQCVAEFPSLEHEATDVDAVEKAWLAADNAVKRLASLLPDYAHSDEKTRVRLARLIDDVDEAYAALRSAAEMPADPTAKPGEGRVPVAPEGVPITGRDGAPLAVASWEVAGNTLTAIAANEIAVYRGPDSVERFAVAPDVVPSLGDGSWGVSLDRRGELRSAALDDAGRLAGAGKVVAKKQVRGFKKTVKITPYYAVGKAQKRVIVYEREFENGIAEVWLQVSHDRGRTWRRSVYIPYAGSRISSHPSWALGQIHLTWDYTGRLHWLPVGEATLGSLMKERTLRKTRQRTVATEACFGKSRVWFIAGRGVIRVEQDDESPPQILSWEIPAGDHYYCDDDRLASVVNERDQVIIHDCGAGGCRKPWRLSRRGSSFTAAAYTASRGLVAATWVEDHLLVFERTEEGESIPRVAFRADEAHLAALLDWGGKLYAMLRTPAKTRLVPIPPG